MEVERLGQRLPFTKMSKTMGRSRFFCGITVWEREMEIKSFHGWTVSLCKEARIKTQIQISVLSKHQG